LSSISEFKIDEHRRLCIKKDLSELNSWTDMLESAITELDHFLIIEKQLIKVTSVSNTIQAMRRKVVLNMASLCKYEQELKTEYEYGKFEYNAIRSKHHEKKRQGYLQLLKELMALKNHIYILLKKYQRK